MDCTAWAKDVSEKIKRKERPVAERNTDKIPYIAIDGAFDDRSGDRIGWWTNGFWGGLMWQMYTATKDEMYMRVAQSVERKLDSVLNDYSVMDHDSGFRWLTTSVAAYRLLGCAESRNRALLAACNLAGRYNPKGEYIVAWNSDKDRKRDGWAIIDCMMNLPLLYWAHSETGEARFLNVALAHADTTIKNFIRDDGSVRHIVEFDPLTGEFLRSRGGQGICDGSSWTRGQSWGLYGFALSYKHTGRERYLDAAEKIADYFVENIPSDGLIPVDFRQDSECGWEDGIAASVAACGLIELSKTAREWKREKYLRAAVKMLKAIDEKRCDYDPLTDNLLTRCSAAYHSGERNIPIVYGDYFYIEAIFRLSGEGLFIW